VNVIFIGTYFIPNARLSELTVWTDYINLFEKVEAEPGD
jgi:hypothetical protein